MATPIFRQKVVDEARQTVDSLPGNEYVPPIQLVADVGAVANRRVSQAIRNGSGTTGTINLTTLDTTRDFYCTGYLLTMAKDATCDASTFVITLSVTPYQETTAIAIAALSYITLTAFAQTVQHTFAHPLRLKRGSVATINGTFTVGAMYRYAILYGYYD